MREKAQFKSRSGKRADLSSRQSIGIRVAHSRTRERSVSSTLVRGSGRPWRGFTASKVKLRKTDCFRKTACFRFPIGALTSGYYQETNMLKVMASLMRLRTFVKVVCAVAAAALSSTAIAGAQVVSIGLDVGPFIPGDLDGLGVVKLSKVLPAEIAPLGKSLWDGFRPDTTNPWGLTPIREKLAPIRSGFAAYLAKHANELSAYVGLLQATVDGRAQLLASYRREAAALLAADRKRSPPAIDRTGRRRNEMPAASRAHTVNWPLVDAEFRLGILATYLSCISGPQREREGIRDGDLREVAIANLTDAYLRSDSGLAGWMLGDSYVNLHVIPEQEIPNVYDRILKSILPADVFKRFASAEANHWIGDAPGVPRLSIRDAYLLQMVISGRVQGLGVRVSFPTVTNGIVTPDENQRGVNYLQSWLRALEPDYGRITAARMKFTPQAPDVPSVVAPPVRAPAPRQIPALFVCTFGKQNLWLVRGTTGGAPSASPVPVKVGEQPLAMAICLKPPTLYVASSQERSISEFSILPDGRLRPLVPATVACSAAPSAISFHPNGKFVYVSSMLGARIMSYRMEADGVLVKSGGSTHSVGCPGPVVFSAAGDFALCGDRHSPLVYQFRVGPDGVLSPNKPAELKLTFTRGEDQCSVALLNDGRVVIGDGDVSVITGKTDTNGCIDPGTLTRLPFPGSADYVVATSDRERAYIASIGGSNVSVLRFGTDGHAVLKTQAAWSGSFLDGMLVSNDGTALCGFHQNGSVDIYQLAVDGSVDTNSLCSVSMHAGDAATGAVYIPEPTAQKDGGPVVQRTPGK